MEYGGQRSSRRARHKPIQSCEIVGILPAEEAALTRALYASLLQESSSTNRTPQKSPTMLITNIKQEPPDEDSDTLLSCSRLSSPELYEEQGYSSANQLCSESCPSSPQSNNSLHLCISSSSWPSSVSSNSSCDSLFLPWSSSSDSKQPKKNSSKGTKKAAKRSLKSKRTLEFSMSPKSSEVDKQNKNKKPRSGKVPTARKSAKNSECVKGSSGDQDNVPYQGRAQRKFAANQVPVPVRCSFRDVKPVTGLKQPPKTEDFITFLNLRGSVKMPKKLKKFESPWTPLRRNKRSTKPKSEVSKGFKK